MAALSFHFSLSWEEHIRLMPAYELDGYLAALDEITEARNAAGA